MNKDSRHATLAAATVDLFDAVFKPGDPTGIGTNPHLLRFAEKVRREGSPSVPHPDLLRGDTLS